MHEFRFSVIINHAPETDETILSLADALGNVGCTDASIRGHLEGMELLFERSAETLQSAIVSAIADIERTGLPILRIELERDAVLQAC